MSIKVKRRKLRNEKQKAIKYTIFEILEDVIDKCLIEITNKDDIKEIYLRNIVN